MVGKRKYNWNLIKKLYEEGHSEIEVSRIAKYKQQTVHYILHHLNIPIRKCDRRGSKNPKWKGGIMYDKKRKLIISPEHPNPDFLKKYCYEYRLIIEKHLGRYLKKGEIVHHIDNDVTNNNISNLKVMTQSEHMKVHKADLLRGRGILK